MCIGNHWSFFWGGGVWGELQLTSLISKSILSLTIPTPEWLACGQKKKKDPNNSFIVIARKNSPTTLITNFFTIDFFFPQRKLFN